jgi:hypothetical protein
METLIFTAASVGIGLALSSIKGQSSIIIKILSDFVSGGVF